MHHGGRAQPPRLLQEHPVLQGQQAPLGVDAVGEGGEVAHVGQGGRQFPAGDEGIGVAVGVNLPLRGVGPGDDQNLALPEARQAVEKIVVPVELA